MLKKLTLGGVFQNYRLIIKDGTITSKQMHICNAKDEDKFIYRIAVFKPPYFNYISGNDSFEIETRDIIRVCNSRFNCDANADLITIEKICNELVISSKSSSIPYDTLKIKRDADKMPFSFVKGVPIINESMLDISLKCDIREVINVTKRLIKNLHISFVLDEEVFLFLWYPDDKRKGRFRRRIYCKVINGDKLNVTFDKEIHKVVNTFTPQSNIFMYAKDKNHPVWISQETREFALGVMFFPLDIELQLESSPK